MQTWIQRMKCRGCWQIIFREDDPKGIAARALYTSLGFEPAELTENFGYPNQRFIYELSRYLHLIPFVSIIIYL